MENGEEGTPGRRNSMSNSEEVGRAGAREWVGACLITLRIFMRLEVRCQEWEGDGMGRPPGAQLGRTWNAMQGLHSSGLGAMETFRESGNERPARGDSDGPGQQ